MIHSGMDAVKFTPVGIQMEELMAAAARQINW